MATRLLQRGRLPGLHCLHVQKGWKHSSLLREGTMNHTVNLIQVPRVSIKATLCDEMDQIWRNPIVYREKSRTSLTWLILWKKKGWRAEQKNKYFLDRNITRENMRCALKFAIIPDWRVEDWPERRRFSRRPGNSPPLGETPWGRAYHRLVSEERGVLSMNVVGPWGGFRVGSGFEW